MTNEETQLLKQFKGAKNGGCACQEIYDFGVRRPTSEDFWEELEKLGKVDQDALKYGVDFQ